MPGDRPRHKRAQRLRAGNIGGAAERVEIAQQIGLAADDERTGQRRHAHGSLRSA